MTKPILLPTALPDHSASPSCEVLRRTVQDVEKFLSRWRDSFTRQHREDLVQESILIAWSQWGSMRRPERFASLARTVARRVRYRALAASRFELERRADGYDMEQILDPASIEVSKYFRVGGEWICSETAYRTLRELLAGDGEQGKILRSFYEGANCREIGARFGLSLPAVKVRLFRGRKRIRRRLEDLFRQPPCLINSRIPRPGGKEQRP